MLTITHRKYGNDPKRTSGLRNVPKKSPHVSINRDANNSLFLKGNNIRNCEPVDPFASK